MYSATLSNMRAGYIYSDMRVCKMLLYQARHLVCHKSIRHAYMQGAAPTGLKNSSLHSDMRVCKMLLYQARHLVCHKSIRHAYMQGAAPTGLKNSSLPVSWKIFFLFFVINCHLGGHLVHILIHHFLFVYKLSVFT